MRRLIVLVEASIQGYLLREGKRKASVASLCELRDHETDKAEGFVGPLLSLKEIKARILLYLLQQLYPQSEHTGTSGLLVVNKAKKNRTPSLWLPFFRKHADGEGWKVRILDISGKFASGRS